MTADQIDTVLRALDPATGVRPERDVDQVLRQVYAQALASGSSRPRRASRRRLMTALGVAAAVAATVTAPVLSRSEPAFATWTHHPQSAFAVRDRAAAEQCHRWVSEDASPAVASTVRLTERRGDWVLTLLTTASGPVTCLSDVDPDGEPSGGLAGPLRLPAAVPASGVVLTSGGGTARDGQPVVRQVVGKVAPDIAAVTLHTAAQGDVDATVLDGWVIAWWPGEPEGHEVRDDHGLLSQGFDSIELTRLDGTHETLAADAVTVPQ